MVGTSAGSVLAMLLHAVRNPSRVRPAALCAALLPKGRRQLGTLGVLVDDLHDLRTWPARTHVAATNYHTGARVVFGRRQPARFSGARGDGVLRRSRLV